MHTRLDGRVLPQTTVSYIHRIGRTGRAGRPGRAVTLFTEADVPQVVVVPVGVTIHVSPETRHVSQLRAIAHVMRSSGCEVPTWMLELKQAPLLLWRCGCCYR